MQSAKVLGVTPQCRRSWSVLNPCAVREIGKLTAVFGTSFAEINDLVNEESSGDDIRSDTSTGRVATVQPRGVRVYILILFQRFFNYLDNVKVFGKLFMSDFALRVNVLDENIVNYCAGSSSEESLRWWC